MIAYLNGVIVPPAELHVGYADAGFVSGVTVTDFCRTYGRRLFRWPLHLARFRRDCAALSLEVPPSDAELTAAAERLVAHNAPLGNTAEVAVVTFATPGPLGYLTGTGIDGPPTVGMHTPPLDPARYARFFADGVTLVSAGRMPESDLVPAGVKHRSRLHWWLAGRSPDVPAGAVPVLLTRDGVADTAIGSVVVVQGDTVIRPPAGAVLESVSLAVLAEACAECGFRFEEGAIDFHSLYSGAAADEVWLTGSGFGVAGAREVRHGDARRTLVWPGPRLVRVQAAWAKLAGNAYQEPDA